MIEIIKANFFAGEVKTFLMQGEYVEILECAYPIDVAMMDRSGAQLSTMRNAEASYFSRPGKYEVIQVTSASAQTVRLFVGSGDAGTRRTSGDVSVVDGEKNRALAGGLYAAASFCEVPAVAKYSSVQIFNPLASGKNLIINGIVGSSSVAGGIVAYGSAVPLANLQAAGRVINKKIGSALGVAVFRWEAVAAATVNSLGLIFSGFNVANGLVSYGAKGPLIVMPGFGVNVVQSQTTNSDLGCTFEWFEDDF